MLLLATRRSAIVAASRQVVDFLLVARLGVGASLLRGATGAFI
jgi:hypothetical protein